MGLEPRVGLLGIVKSKTWSLGFFTVFRKIARNLPHNLGEIYITHQSGLWLCWDVSKNFAPRKSWKQGHVMTFRLQDDNL